MNQFPVTVKRSIELFGLCLIGMLLILGSNIIMPLLMAFFISIMLLPIYRFFRKRGLSDTISIILPILVLAIAVSLLIWFFSAQVSNLVSDFPQIKKNVNIHLASLSNWINSLTNYSTSEQVKFIDEQSNKFVNGAGSVLSGIAGSLSGLLLFFGLLPIYIFLILNYKNLLLKFTFMWFKEEDHKNVEGGLRSMEDIIKSYLLGLLIQIGYITILLGGILMIVGIKHALLIGVLFALLNLIPYIGALIGNLIGVLLTVSSSQEVWPIITVLAVIAAVQFLDNNILMPRIVGSKVKINSLSAIVGIIFAGTVAGISGMFLALPIIAVLKIIFDRSTGFEKWGVLLGDEMPAKSPISVAGRQDPGSQENSDSK